MVEVMQDGGYRIHIGDDDGWQDLQFQQGPAGEVGHNGIQIEALLVVCIHRLEELNQGKWQCKDNDVAIAQLKQAATRLNHRMEQRIKRGVEGMDEP